MHFSIYIPYAYGMYAYAYTQEVAEYMTQTLASSDLILDIASWSI